MRCYGRRNQTEESSKYTDIPLLCVSFQTDDVFFDTCVGNQYFSSLYGGGGIVFTRFVQQVI